MDIIDLSQNEIASFKDLFCDYFDELKCDIPKDVLVTRVLDGLILEEYKNGILFIKIIKNNSMVTGFIIYQVDSEKSDWNKRPGWGFIREFYIIPSYRNTGLGSKMLDKIETHLKMIGVEKIYLTSDENEQTKKFYLKNGYFDELEIDEVRECKLFCVNLLD